MSAAGRQLARVTLYLASGAAVTLASTFVGKRSAAAAYPEIMGCEQGCSVVASGWPLIFVRDYLGMSVINSADILEVWFAADRFNWGPFIFNVGFWSFVAFATGMVLRRSA